MRQTRAIAHCVARVDVVGGDRKVVTWGFETGGVNALDRRGWRKAELLAGTVVVIDGWRCRAKNGPPKANAYCMDAAERPSFVRWNGRARMLRVAAKRRAIEPTSGAAAATSTLAEFASAARSRQICPAGKHLWTKRWNGVSRRGSSSPVAGGIRITRCTAMRRLAHARDEIHRTAVGPPYRGRRNPVLPITTLRTRLARLGWNQTTGGRTQLAPA